MGPSVIFVLRINGSLSKNNHGVIFLTGKNPYQGREAEGGGGRGRFDIRLPFLLDFFCTLPLQHTKHDELWFFQRSLPIVGHRVIHNSSLLIFLPSLVASTKVILSLSLQLSQSLITNDNSSRWLLTTLQLRTLRVMQMLRSLSKSMWIY